MLGIKADVNSRSHSPQMISLLSGHLSSKEEKSLRKKKKMTIFGRDIYKEHESYLQLFVEGEINTSLTKCSVGWLVCCTQTEQKSFGSSNKIDFNIVSHIAIRCKNDCSTMCCGNPRMQTLRALDQHHGQRFRPPLDQVIRGRYLRFPLSPANERPSSSSLADWALNNIKAAWHRERGKTAAHKGESLKYIFQFFFWYAVF